jgi:hypothetical protein
LRPDDSRKQKCKHPWSKAKGGVEGGVGRLSAAREKHLSETTAGDCGIGWDIKKNLFIILRAQ